jgi:hypothetical protein
MTAFRSSALIAGVLLAASSLQAQSAGPRIDPRWRPFIGCWASFGASTRGPTVCLLPTDAPERIEMVSVSNDSIVSRSTVTANGTRTPVTRDGCTGWESGTWSEDDRRIYTRAEFRCGGGLTQIATGIYAMTTPEAFARIEGVKTNGAARARVVNFVWVDTVRVPAYVSSRLPDFNAMRISGARVEAAADLALPDVIEAAKTVEAGVVEAWIANRAQPFTVGARHLRTLRDAGVPPTVIDIVVAVSHPKVFAVTPGLAPEAALRGTTPVNLSGLSFAERDAYEREIRNLRLRSAFGWGFGDPMFNTFGFNDWNSGFFSPFGWNGFNNPYFFRGGFFNPYSVYGTPVYGGGLGGGTIISGGPYVIVPAQPVQNDQGRVINGAGYSATKGSGGGGIARPTPSVSSGGGYSSGGGGGGSASTGGGASGGGGGERTAKPRP